ncbi:hypothetical protein [Saccharothrix sp. ST-888]|uniref:hypothetical protein n=1 Tax=Saccharothrix sp. ST-888 TaxID=1427391 RepID=UPI0005EC830D|nr:hypothetical protein [Saccharothrix sp. ST-888]
MSDLTPAQALGQGARIPLRDGTDAELYYSFRSLALLEARFGSVQGIQDAIDQTGGGAAFGALLDLLGAGLVGEGGFTGQIRYRQTADGARTVEEIVYRRTVDGRDLGDLLALVHIHAYVTAMQATLIDCLGAGSPGNGPSPAVSPGPTSSTSEPSSSAAAPPSSGL